MFQNIKVGIVTHHPKEHDLSVNGDRINDYEAVFNHMYYDGISQATGHDKWGVWFKQQEEVGPSFLIEIYANSKEDISRITRLISHHQPSDMKFRMMPSPGNFDYFVQETAE